MTTRRGEVQYEGGGEGGVSNASPKFKFTSLSFTRPKRPNDAERFKTFRDFRTAGPSGRRSPDRPGTEGLARKKSKKDHPEIYHLPVDLGCLERIEFGTNLIS